MSFSAWVKNRLYIAKQTEHQNASDSASAKEDITIFPSYDAVKL